MKAWGPHGGGKDGSFLSSYDCCRQYIRLIDAYGASSCIKKKNSIGSFGRKKKKMS